MSARHYLFGRWDGRPLDDDGARALVAAARERREALRRVPRERILALLDRVGRRWLDAADPLYREVMAEAPAQIGFSPAMVAEEIRGMGEALRRDYLEPKLARELGDPAALDGWSGGVGRPVLRALPRGVVLHVASGNALTVGPLSVAEGLVTKNVNLLKAASRSTLVPLAFARALAEADDGGDVAGALAVVSWPGGRSQVHKVFQRECDAIVVWGSEDVVQVYREGLALKTKLIEYGPRVSFGAIGAELLDAPATARDAAYAVGLWDQTACSSPQVLYVEDASAEHVATRAFAGRLAAELAALQRELPLGPLDLQERAEITKERELAEVTEALGLGELRAPGRDPDWTVICEWEPAFKLSPLFRTIYVKPLPDLAALPGLLAPYADYLQTAGLAAAPERALALAEALLDRGVLRVTPLRGMTGGQAGEPHDGGFALQQLVRWVSLDLPELGQRYDAAEWRTAAEQQALSFELLRRQVEEVAPRAPLYRERLAGLALRRWEDFAAVPPLTQAELRAASPPRGESVFTEPPAGAHFLRSGGSTGEPKLSAFAYADYEEDMARAARGLYAAGLRRGDRVANLFMAGNLYGSFLSINRALELVGCNSFPFTHATLPGELAPLLRAFAIDTLMGLPSWLAQVFEALKADGGWQIRKVFYTGEHLYPEDQARLRRDHGVETIGSLGYGSVDGGPMGFQCAAATGGVHHLHADHQLLELVDPQTLAPVAPGEPGEVLVTNLNRRLMPLLRYRIGDLARWVAGPCACGRTMPRFELLGRVDDYLVAGGINIGYADLHAAAAEVDGLAGPLQLQVARHDGCDLLTLLAEAQDGPPDLAERVAARVLARQPALRRAVEAGQLHPLAVEILPPGGIARNPRTGKIRRVVDGRLG